MDTETPLAYTAAEVAAKTRLSKAYVYQLIAEDQLPACRIGRSVRVLHADLVQYLNANRTVAA